MLHLIMKICVLKKSSMIQRSHALTKLSTKSILGLPEPPLTGASSLSWRTHHPTNSFGMEGFQSFLLLTYHSLQRWSTVPHQHQPSDGSVRKGFFTVMVTDHRSPRDAVESPSLEIFKYHLDTVLGNLLYMTQFEQGCWTR